MEEKKYLNFFNKVGYGSGDWAANMVYGIVTSFVMIYLTNTVGLNAGIVGTLIMLSKFADGVTDVLFGTLIDRTHSKMGKARPWMFYSYIGNAICLILLFAIPAGLGDTAKYAYFFITYTLLNAIFYTANNVSYSSLTSLITKNGSERVQLGTFRFIFATCANLFVSNMTTRMVASFGSDAAAWRTVAIIYAVIGIVVNTISVFSVKELPEEELAEGMEKVEAPEKITLIDTLKTLVVNPYFDMLTLIYVMGYLSVSVSLGAAVYYFTYVTGDVNMYGTFMTMYSIPSVVGLIAVPFLVAKFKSIRNVNLASFVIQCVFRVLFLFFTIAKNIPAMLVLFALCSLTNCSMMGTFNALVAEASEYTRHKTGKQLDGSMYSCTSFGMKVGSGIGSGLMGWLLAAAGFSQELAVQSTACNNMFIFMFAGVPIIVTVATTIIYYFLKVEKKNIALRAN
jgi:GPH family glycoside/pentoside/hexuronide:cation symporter